MHNVRLIARLDIKGPNLIKAVHLEGLRVMGDPQLFATRYYEMGADELIFLDTVASLYGRNNLHEIVTRAAKHIFIPLTVGGGVRTIEDITTLLRSGADKVAINTAATKNPEFIRVASERFGSQCIVLSIAAKRIGQGKWIALTDNGRENSGLDVLEWAHRGWEMGAGEILLTSVDQEGTAEGFDDGLVREVTSRLPIPVIASGGMGSIDHLESVIRESKADAVAMAHVLHYNKLSIPEIKNQLTQRGINVRTDAL